MKQTIKIKGMYCGSCEVLIERKFRKIEGVEAVHAHQGKGEVVVHSSRDIPLSEFTDALDDNRYSIVSAHDSAHNAAHAHTDPESERDSGTKGGSGTERRSKGEDDSEADGRKPNYYDIGTAAVVFFTLYFVLNQLNLIPDFGISESMTYGVVFVIGLFAAVSTCMAVTGGLLLAVSARYAEQHPHLSGIKKFKPHLYFNAGRLVFYALLGGLVGAVGSVLSLSPLISGIIMILASLFMVIIGLQFLRIFPWLNRFQVRMPKSLAHYIHEKSSTDHRFGPFLLGGATFFLPCGFTQALQLLVLGKGDPVIGALTMFVFALGTTPALLSLGALTSFVRGSVQKHIVVFSGVLLILLGLFNATNAAAFIGADLLPPSFFRGDAGPSSADPNVKIVDGTQVINMKIVGYDYYPSRFTVYEGVPVKWTIDASQAYRCAHVIIAPNADIMEYLPQTGNKTIEFTPAKTGNIAFGCTMWMTTRGAGFEVVENTAGIKAAAPSASSSADAGVGAAGSAACDPKFANCNVQKLSMEITKERGFYPNVFTVKKNLPVELEINTKVQMGGCMSAMVIPEYFVAHKLAIGRTVLKFTPTRAGTIFGTCSMGSRMVTFNVVD